MLRSLINQSYEFASGLTPSRSWLGRYRPLPVRGLPANRLQTSLNLALGSALAVIGLMIPAVAAVAIVLGQPLELGLGDKDRLLLALTLLIGVTTLGTGRTTVLRGIAHLVIFAAFLFFAAVP